LNVPVGALVQYRHRRAAVPVRPARPLAPAAQVTCVGGDEPR